MDRVPESFRPGKLDAGVRGPHSEFVMPWPLDPDDLKKRHSRLLDEIRWEAEDTARYTGRAQFSDRVMAAMETVARHAFVPAEEAYSAYANRPLPIGHGQTISQPYIVALMSDLLDLEPTDRVLEIGTGSGYQTAVLAELAAEVYSVETVRDLATVARERLKTLGYGNVRVRHSDGWEGWPEEAPFDAVIVTAAPEIIPPRLIEQLAIGGRLVVPVGRVFETQMLTLCTKGRDGKTDCRTRLPVAFVPMVKGEK